MLLTEAIFELLARRESSQASKQNSEWKSSRVKLDLKFPWLQYRSTITMHADKGMPEDISMAITGRRDMTVHRQYRQVRDSNILAAAKAFDELLPGSRGHAEEEPKKTKPRK